MSVDTTSLAVRLVDDRNYHSGARSYHKARSMLWEQFGAVSVVCVCVCVCICYAHSGTTQ